MEYKSNKVLKWFCKNIGAPINVSSGYPLASRLDAFGITDHYVKFIDALTNECKSFEEFLTTFNDTIRESMISDIKSSAVFKALQERDMNIPEDTIKYPSDRSDKIFSREGIGKVHISIDMIAANFNALNMYAKELGLPTLSNLIQEGNPAAGYDYESYVNNFTSWDCFQSKHFREVIFGNCNPKRIVTLEKYYMVELYRYLVRYGMLTEDAALSLSHDEIVLRYDSYTSANDDLNKITEGCSKYDVPVKVRMFTVSKISDQDDRLVGYIRKTIKLWDTVKGWKLSFELPTYDMKCVSSTDAVFVLRYLNNEPVQDEDLVFEVEGRYVKLINKPVLRTAPDLHDELVFKSIKDGGSVVL